MTNIISLVENGRNPLADVPYMLRNLADRIEAGEYGDIKDPDFIIRCILVLRVSGKEPLVMGFGDIEHVSQSFIDLHAGAAELLSMRHPER